MTITANSLRPISTDITLSWFARINWLWLVQRIPIIALAIDSSYNIAKYIGLDGTPLIIQVIAGTTFDLIFIGLVGLADQYRTTKKSGDVLYWVINIGAMLLAAIFSTLAFSEGAYARITLESFTRGSGFPILGLLYNLLYHTLTSDAIERERKEIAENPHQCEYCKRRFNQVKKLNGHLAQCSKKPAKP